MVDREFVVQRRLEGAQDRRRLADALVGQQHVGREHVGARPDRPDVQVVNVADARKRPHARAHDRNLGVRGCAFEQHVGGLAHDPNHAGHDQRRDAERDRRVDPRRVRGEDRQAAESDGSSADHVATHVQQRGPHVHVPVRAAQQREADAEVDREADGREDRHRFTVRGFGSREAPDRLDRDRDGHAEEEEAVGQRREDLEARVPVAAAVGGGAPHLDCGRHRDAERDGIHEHVRRIGEQRETVRYEAAAEFDAGHDEREDQRRDQRRAVLAVVLVMMSAQATTAFAPSASSIAPKVTNVRLSARAITPAS